MGPVLAAPTLYVFFATWCVPCRQELPAVQLLSERYRDRGLRVQLVSEDAPSSAAEVPAFLRELGVDLPYVVDRDSELLLRFHPAASIPFAVLVDSRGGVQYAHAGYAPGEERALATAVEALLVQAPTSASSAPIPLTARASLQSQGQWRRSRFVARDDPPLLAGATRLEIGSRYGSAEGPRCDRPVGCAEASLRVDGVGIAEIGTGEITRDGAVWDGRIERASLGWQQGGLRLRVGDSHLAVGHGLALSLRRIDTLGVDTALRGGRLNWRGPWHRLMLAGGQINTQNLDPVLLQLQPDPGDTLAAAELRLGSEEQIQIGPHLVAARLRRTGASGGDQSWLSAGLVSEAKLGMLHWRGDAAVAQSAVQGTVQGAAQGEAVAQDIPWAAYLAVDSATGPWTGLLEIKAYRSWQLGRPGRLLSYQQPPSLEREDQQVASSQDAAGARVRLGWRATPALSVHGNLLSYRYSLDGSPAWTAQTALHGYLGAELRRHNRGSSALSVGLRQELEPDGSSRLRFWHLDLDLARQIAPWLSLSANWNHRDETKTLLLSDLQFIRGQVVLVAAWPEVMALSLLYGYTTESAQRPLGYPAAELRVPLPRGGELRLFGGRLAGGRVCVSGSCRDLPPFEGLRFDLVLRI